MVNQKEHKIQKDIFKSTTLLVFGIFFIVDAAKGNLILFQKILSQGYISSLNIIGMLVVLLTMVGGILLLALYNKHYVINKR